MSTGLISGALLVAAAASYAVLFLGGDGRPWAALLPLACAAGAAAIALAAWHRLRAERDLERAERERAVEAARAEMEREMEAAEHELERERSLRVVIERNREQEKQWRRRLAEEMLKAQRDDGALGDPHNVPSMVLRIAMVLLEARKGLLLSRHHRPDGELELLAAHGFDADPSDSALAQHFATEVIERDTTVRRDGSPPVSGDGQTAADEEIDNLVAIPTYVKDQFTGVIVCANRPGGFHDHDDEVLLSLGDHASALLGNAELRGQLRSSYLATIRILADALEAKDPFLRGHSEEVSAYVAAVADRLEVGPKRREELVFGSLLHDLGKIGISERVLLKPGPLTAEEFNIVKLHPRIGYRLVQQVPALDDMCLGILHHHERYDGTGYPNGLKGEEIPLEARIICVADSFSAMTSDRPYRGRMSVEDACDELVRCAGTQFDPEIVRVFVDEVRNRPQSRATRGELAIALSDPELDGRRDGDEPLLGYGTYAIIDNLTLLYSRRYLHEVVHAEAQRAAVQDVPFGVALFELRDISEVNRRDGYAAGDAAIRALAEAVQRGAVRAGGTACRYGGPRIALVVPRADDDALRALADEIARDAADGAVVRTGVGTWRTGDDGDAVVARAYESLATPAATTS
ncbi:MAG TPA: HD domain-containing phosphohydrolase [Actinomycetota bacterium]|nr:HD domain-containing phosphohydrolase [Actinomycetota bacterium]